MSATAQLADGLFAFVKRACPTCTLIERELKQAAQAVPGFRVIAQDDPKFPPGVADVVDDRELDLSFVHDIEYTPTLVVKKGGREVERVVGWDRAAWQRLTGIAGLGAALPPMQPG